MKLDGRIAVVSGAFRGIGKASAEILATEGAHVIALDIIDGEPVYASPRIAYRRFDVASPQMWDDLAKELERIDILVNSAGITQTRSGLTDLDLSEWNRIIASLCCCSRRCWCSRWRSPHARRRRSARPSPLRFRSKLNPLDRFRR